MVWLVGFVSFGCWVLCVLVPWLVVLSMGLFGLVVSAVQSSGEDGVQRFDPMVFSGEEVVWGCPF